MVTIILIILFIVCAVNFFRGRKKVIASLLEGNYRVIWRPLIFLSACVLLIAAFILPFNKDQWWMGAFIFMLLLSPYAFCSFINMYEALIQKETVGK